MADDLCFFNKDTLIIKAPKKSPLVLRMIVLMFAMVCGVYICTICLKQISTHSKNKFLNVQVLQRPCHASGIEQWEIPYIHYPKPKTYSRAECECNPVRFFAILSMQRSGSGWFETLLNSHINVSSNGEIFSVKQRRSNVSSIVETLDKVYNLDWFSSASKKECSAAVGFKWMLNQVNDYAKLKLVIHILNTRYTSSLSFPLASDCIPLKRMLFPLPDQPVIVRTHALNIGVLLLLASLCQFFVSAIWEKEGLMEHHEEIVEYFNSRGVSAIFLFRRNQLRRLISILANSYDRDAKLLNGTHKSHVHSPHEVSLSLSHVRTHIHMQKSLTHSWNWLQAEILAKYKPTINATLLIPNLKQVQEMTIKALEYFNSTRHIILYYEDIINNRTKLIDVQDFLRVPQRDLKSRQVKIHKGSLSELVGNWDDVHKTLKGTAYESFLHADYQM
ncbi:hypothetical protein HHK36_030902 [Tetracentron sinense]|uniref:Sulfotransferase n=1 Tax=Tetracentron sinense TaxID=13715 RepID=A0A834YDM2_TETSI|nr:hypothetical protein HHK36_030902 [Tetracentron sinense]